MSITKHTPEPWGDHAINKPDHGVIHAMRGAHIGTLKSSDSRSDSNAARIVACINACAGIEDPAAALSNVRQLLRSWKRDIECPDDRDEIDNILRELGGQI